MATDDRYGGTFRSDYETDRARLNGFTVLTDNTDRLLHHLIRASRTMPCRDENGREHTLTSLLENHVLTVLADICRKELKGYDGSFANVQGTTAQKEYVRKLEREIRHWMARLDKFLYGSWLESEIGDTSEVVARELRDRLNHVLTEKDDDDSHRYFQMLRTVTSIQNETDNYRQRIENCGDIEPSIALLTAYLRNYAGIAGAFNQRLATLPDIYRRDILHAVPKEATPDNAYIIVNPTDSNCSTLIGRSSFTLEKGTTFAAGDGLTYGTTRKEYISPMRCVSAQTIYKDRNGLHLQTFDFENTDTAESLFTGSMKLQTGKQVESPMFILEEGVREVTVLLHLKSSNPSLAEGKKQGFILQYSTVDKWTDIDAECTSSGDYLRFLFTIGQDGAAPEPCAEETHGMVTTYPALRILTSNDGYPVWAEEIEFESITIKVSVSGIHDFTLYNELGEVDTTQPFPPFGTQAERGAWFLFGNREMGMKPLKEVTLRGKWQKVPETRAGFNDIYRDYGIGTVNASSFRIRTEYQQERQWHPCADGGQELFGFDGNGRMQDADITFRFPHTNILKQTTEDDIYEYARDKDGFFRVTLDCPHTGFGVTAYRNRFTEVMIHNGRCKEKKQLPIPQEPPVPMLADVELEYKAEKQIPMTSTGGKHRIVTVTFADTSDTPPCEDKEQLLPVLPSDRILCLAFADAVGEQGVRIYTDMALPQDRIPYSIPDTDVTVRLTWQYWNGVEWEKISADNIVAEETAGLTQSGYIEIYFGDTVRAEWQDSNGRIWLRAALTDDDSTMPADTTACLALRGVWTNCIRVTAQGGDGMPLPAGTILATVEDDGRVGSVMQPMPGFGGMPAETEAQSAACLAARLSNRHRAVTARDYEQILLEHFPEVDFVRCLTLSEKESVKGAAEIRIVTLSRAEDRRYFLSSPWKLKEMERTLRKYAPACVRLRVVNPLYEKVMVRCRATLHCHVRDMDKVKADMTRIAENYLMPWRRNGSLPVPGQTFSVKGLYARMINHEDLKQVSSLEVECPEGRPVTDDTIRGTEIWSVLLPSVSVELLSPDDGIGSNGVGEDFIVG